MIFELLLALIIPFILTLVIVWPYNFVPHINWHWPSLRALAITWLSLVGTGGITAFFVYTPWEIKKFVLLCLAIFVAFILTLFSFYTLFGDDGNDNNDDLMFY